MAFYNILYLSLGAVIGALLRYAAVLFLPMPILVVNVIGSFVIGFCYAKFDFNQQYLHFINTGILGALTTFSSFNLELLIELNKGAFLWFFAYALLTVLLSFAACYAGYRLALC